MPELSTIQIFYTVLLATTFLTQGLIAVWVYRYQWAQSGAKWFLIIVGTGMVWVLPYTFFFVVTNPTYQYVAHGIGFFGALSTVGAFVVFASSYTEAGFHHNRLVQAHLVAIIGGYLLLAPTNNMHHLLFADFRAVSEPFSYIAVQRGVVFWGMLLSLQIPGLYAYYRLVTYLRSSQRHGGGQLILFTVGALSINTLDYVDHLTTLLPMDGFPDALLGMFVFYLFVAVALFRFNLLDVKPVARKTVIENLHDPVLVIGEQNRLVDFNEAATAVWPALPDRLLDSFETACPEVEATVDIPLEGTFTTELTIERNGVEHHYSVTTSAVTADGTETGWYSIVLREITDRREREQELEELTTRLQLALDETNTGVWEWDLDTDDVIWDETSEQLFGYKPGEFPDSFAGFANRVPDEDLKYIHEQIDHAIESGEQYRTEFRVQLPAEDQRWIQARGIVVYDSDDDAERLLGVQTDITERKQREEKLRKREQALEQAREQLRQTIDLIPDPLFVKNLDDEVLLSNEANAELHGMTPEEIEGKREFDIESEVENIENFDKYRQREIEVIETGESMTFEEELLDPDGEKRIFKTTRIPFETWGTDEDAVLGYARDVTDLKEYEQELEETNEKLDHFAGVVSHDLRNPLNVIKGRAELLRAEAPDEHVEPIERMVERMETMIEDLLILSRAGESVTDPEPISLATVVADSWAAVSSDGLELDVDIPDDVEVAADGDRLRQTFENLFRNAGEHNDPPVTIRLGTLTDETAAVSGFFVADDGTGIPESERAEVFDQGYTTNRDGTGFGLSIVKEIVEAHGWTISVSESDTGGARFNVHMIGRN
jgi:PAS domain S-box-containing protein